MLKEGCELGDLSGRHGNLAATTTLASGGVLATTNISHGSKSSSEAIMDSCFPGCRFWTHFWRERCGDGCF